MTRRCARVLVCLLVGAAAAAWGPVRRTAAEETPDARSAEDREHQVMSFVAEHQPELAAVLGHLKKQQPADYARAIEDLDRKVRPLLPGRGKDERLRTLELSEWQARTRVELIVARWMAGKRRQRAALEAELARAVEAELAARAECLAYRKQRSAAWYDRQIVRLAEKRDELVAARVKSLLGDEAKKDSAEQ